MHRVGWQVLLVWSASATSIRGDDALLFVDKEARRGDVFFRISFTIIGSRLLRRCLPITKRHRLEYSLSHALQRRKSARRAISPGAIDIHRKLEPGLLESVYVVIVLTFRISLLFTKCSFLQYKFVHFFGFKLGVNRVVIHLERTKQEFFDSGINGFFDGIKRFFS